MPTKRKAPKNIELVFRLDGKLREVDVFRLAPALLSIGHIIQTAHEELGVEHDVGVNVRPFSKGSFVVDISLFVQTNFPLLMFGTTAVAAAMGRTTDVLAALGLIHSKTESLVSAIKKLRGKPDAVEKISPNEYRYTSKAGDVVVNGPVNQLMQNPTIHAEVMYVCGNPMEQENVTGLSTFLRNDTQSEVKIAKDDAPSFVAYSRSALLPTEAEEKIVGDPMEYFLRPKRVSVEGEADNWSFRIAGSDEVIHIDKVTDEAFLEGVRNGRYRFSKDDLITARIVQTQLKRGAEVTIHRELILVEGYEEAPHHFQPPLSGLLDS